MARLPDVRRLRFAAIVFAAAVLVHNGDHLRRGGDAVDADVFVLGTFGMVLETAVVLLVLMNHRHAPLVAASVGSSLAAGYLLVHLAPARPWLSDSLSTGDDVTWFSWIAVAALVFAALALAVTAWSVLQTRAALQPSSPPGPPPGRVLHPVTTALIVGNVLILAGSVATL